MGGSLAWILTVAVGGGMHAQGDPIVWRTRHVEWAIGPDGRNVRFLALKSGRECLDPNAGSCAFLARVGAETRVPTAVRRERDTVHVTFGDPATWAEVRVVADAERITMDVVEVTDAIEELTFGQAVLSLRGEPGEPIAACVLARNVSTNVPELPGASSILRAVAYRRLGFRGASAAFIAVPPSGLRQALQRAVEASPDLPRSPIGGPWAMDSKPNRRSYLFNFGDLNVEASKPWIELAHALGAGQVDFHGGTSFRFGDFLPNPKTYPNGLSDLKATVDALHAAGLQAGLHTYAFFIDKRAKYVTPVPDPRLASARTFTLAEAVDASADTIVVREATQGITSTTGFFVTNSATLRIGQELVTFREASQTPPWRFTGCVRGALGTKAAAHAAGERADQLKELFGLFAPDAETDLFLEIVENTARTYNTCGFDMIYLDALDGSYIHAGAEWAWHYGARFVYELVRRLNKPAIMEMSTFHHHLWCVRARMGAWDAPHTGFKEFVDMHRVVNRDCARIFLPSHLGWWGVWGWNPIQPDRTLPDDLEYLLCKALADDAGVSFVHGFSPESFAKSPGAQRYAGMIRQYEELRKAGATPPSIRKRLGEPGAEFVLEAGPKGKRAFVPTRYEKRAVAGTSTLHTISNPYAAQPLLVRIEAGLGADGQAAPIAPLLSADDVGRLSAPRCAEGVTMALSAEASPPGVAGSPERYLAISATSARRERTGSWAVVDHFLPAQVDMNKKGIAVWVHGDGQGEVLNFQLRAPDNLGPGVAERYVVVDFVGWRRCVLIEPESDGLSRYSWPYAGSRAEWERNPSLAFTSAYKTYHPWLALGQVHCLSVWINELPPGRTVQCRIGPVVPMATTTAAIADPEVEVAGRSVRFPVSLETGQYLELGPDGVVRVYGAENEQLRTLKPEGTTPTLAPGANAVRFSCRAGSATEPRGRLTVILRDKPLRF